jgi:hypothetical protein
MLSQAQRAVIAVLLCLVVWLAWLDSTSWRNQRSSGCAEQAPYNGSAPIVAKQSPDKITDWLLVALNFFLVSSTFLLWQANNRSARTAERALTELEAPFLTITISQPGLNIQASRVTFGQLKWRVTNYGRSPATILEIFDTLRQVDEGHGFAAAN